VTLRGLAPGTEYAYRLSSDEGAAPSWSPPFRARTAPAAETASYRFAFLSDTCIMGRPDGLATGVAQVLAELVEERPLFVLGGGDYAYSDRDGRFPAVADAVDAWFDQMQPLISGAAFLPQYGNHEVRLRERWRDWAPRLAHPVIDGYPGCYSFEVGAAHFTSLFVPSAPPDAGLLAWLDADLEQARRQGARWRIVYQHEPIFGHGRSHPASPEVRRALTPFFEKHHVDLHLSGHDQNYERTFPLRGAAGRPEVASRATNLYPAGAGVVYAKVSPAGKKSDIGRDFSRFAAGAPAHVAVRDDTAHHYALVTVSEEALQMDVYAVRGDGSARTLLDSFRIVRGIENTDDDSRRPASH
jgi:hypothetical protein